MLRSAETRGPEVAVGELFDLRGDGARAARSNAPDRRPPCVNSTSKNVDRIDVESVALCHQSWNGAETIIANAPQIAAHAPIGPRSWDARAHVVDVDERCIDRKSADVKIDVGCIERESEPPHAR